MEVERVWVQKAGSCIVDWLFCKRGQEKQVSETCSNKKKKKERKKMYGEYMALLTMEKGPIWVTDRALRGICTVFRQASR